MHNPVQVFRAPYVRLSDTLDLSALLTGQRLRATRPLHFFRPAGPMPDVLELPLTLPAELGPAGEVVSELRDRVRAVELLRAAERGRTGRRVLGRRAVLAQSWREFPASVEPRGTSGLRSRREARGRGSRRCCAIARSSASTPAPARGGETACPTCSGRPARYSSTAVAGHPSPSACKTTHRSNVGIVDVPATQRAGLFVPPN
jgi:hypothetical protein